MEKDYSFIFIFEFGLTRKSGSGKKIVAYFKWVDGDESAHFSNHL